jgi:hypothetical protein
MNLLKSLRERPHAGETFWHTGNFNTAFRTTTPDISFTDEIYQFRAHRAIANAGSDDQIEPAARKMDPWAAELTHPIAGYSLLSMTRILMMLLLTAGISTFGLAKDSGPTPARQLDREAASRIAMTLANQSASKLFGPAPFAASQGDLSFLRGHWEWQAIAGYGTGDLLATVTFSPGGSETNSSVQALILKDPPHVRVEVEPLILEPFY